MLSSIALAQNAPAPATAPASNSFITGVGNYSHIVADLDKSLAFYRDVIGLQPNAPPGTPAVSFITLSGLNVVPGVSLKPRTS